MSSRHVALRILLSLSLITNGSGAAMSGTHSGSGAAHEASVDQGSAIERPCHEAQVVDAAGSSSGTGVLATAPPPIPADCCATGSCLCACVHQSQATVPGVSPGSVTAPAGIATALRSEHSTPALPQMIRPPIG